jgi:carbon monoxide dehydrogenase subunit G
MASIDVTAEIQIAAEPTDVASVMFDPQREPEWMTAVKSVQLVDPGIKPGARVRRTGSFVGQEFTWTTAVESFHFPHALTLQIVDGPFTGIVSYSVQRSGAGSVARITNRGESNALGFLPASMIEGGMRKMLEGDLARLKDLIEKQ